jgi:hypothetical protein
MPRLRATREVKNEKIAPGDYSPETWVVYIYKPWFTKEGVFQVIKGR